MDNALLHDGLAYWAREAPTRPALVVDDDPPMDYATLARLSDAAAVALQAAGVKPGDNVAITGDNSLEWVVGAFGIVKAGGVIVPMNERYVADEFEYLIETCRPTAIIADDGRRRLIEPLSHPSPIIAMEGVADLPPAPPGWVGPRVPSDTLAMIMFTSGTTARPKGAMMVHGQHLGKTYETMLADLDYGPRMRQLMTVSLHSNAGTGHGFFTTTLCGGAFYFMRKFEPRLALRILQAERITHFFAFPVVLQRILALDDYADAELSSIAVAYSGGARVAPELLQAWRAKGVPMAHMYGQTEVGGLVCLSSREEIAEGRLTCGRPLPFTRIRILDDDGAPCGPNEPGHVQIKGPGMMIGYWNNPEATAQAFDDGWIRTGDLGMLDDQGRFGFAERARDMIITGGFNVAPGEVERVIGGVAGVHEVCVFALPDERFGEAVAACVHAAPGVSIEAIQAQCTERLAGFKRPREIHLWNGPLPRMASSKVDKRGLVSHYTELAAQKAGQI